MFKNILLTLDNSSYAPAVIEYGTWFGKLYKARLIGISVVDIKRLESPLVSDMDALTGVDAYHQFQPKIRELLQNRSNLILEELNQKCKENDLLCQSASPSGIIEKEITEASKNVDLVIIGQKGENEKWKNEFLGSNVEKVIRSIKRPVLVVPNFFKKIKNVLLAYDGTDYSVDALHSAAHLASELQLTLTLFNASRTVENAHSVLNVAIEYLKPYQLKTKTIVSTDQPHIGIIKSIEEGDFDLLVMGAYGHSHIRELIIGSTIARVLPKVNIPVLLHR